MFFSLQNGHLFTARWHEWYVLLNDFKMLFLVRLVLLIIVFVLLIRAVIRFFAQRFIRQQWPFQSLYRKGGDGTSVSGAAEDADFEVIETTMKDN